MAGKVAKTFPLPVREQEQLLRQMLQYYKPPDPPAALPLESQWAVEQLGMSAGNLEAGSHKREKTKHLLSVILILIHALFVLLLRLQWLYFWFEVSAVLATPEFLYLYQDNTF